MSDVALKEYMEAQLQALRDHVEMMRLARDEAWTEAQRRIDDKFESVNRFREQIREERVAFTRREVAEALLDRVSKLELEAANTTGRWWLIGLMASGLGAAVGLLLGRMIGVH